MDTIEAKTTDFLQGERIPSSLKHTRVANTETTKVSPNSSNDFSHQEQIKLQLSLKYQVCMAYEGLNLITKYLLSAQYVSLC